MLRLRRPPAQTGPIRQSEPPALRLLLGPREAFLSPDPFPSRVVHPPAGLLEPRRAAARAIAPLRPDPGHDSTPEGALISRPG